MNNQLAFLCGARDFHAMDWYKSAKKLLPEVDCCIVTDLITGEGFQKIINEEDKVFKLLIIDSLLFRGQSALGDKWRNLLKLLILPLQVILLKRFAKKYPNTVYHAHSMYYLVLARAAKVNYVGTPQGSDILVKPNRSIFYKYFTIYGLKKAKYITVDSIEMQSGVYSLIGKNAYVIQNGIDVSAIEVYLGNFGKEQDKTSFERSGILSMRGLTELYRIKDVLKARNQSTTKSPITLIYPFYENNYKKECAFLLKENDLDLGRVERNKMYELFSKSELVISIPISDSSPRSVYEAIFCGSPVAITYNSYYEALPNCMKSRIIIIDLSNRNWFAEALCRSLIINQIPYVPSLLAYEIFDQNKSFRKLQKLLFE